MNPDLAMLEHTARAVDTILGTIYGRKPTPLPEEPQSDCCFAPLERVGDELYACSACGRLCSDGTVSLF
jgi:hypothetical protein